MSLFDPASVAVIGASAQPGKVGHDILKNLLTQGYAGAVHPVNPKRGEILGKTAVASVAEIEGPVEMAVIVTPAPTVMQLATECGEKGVKTLVVITAGFKEVGSDEGRAREEELAGIAKRFGMRLVGANCLGLLRPSLKLNASFAKELPPEGGVALISQSGALAVALMDAAPGLRLGFSVVASIGNKTAMDECDYLEACLADERTKVIGLYLESINDGARFRAVASAVAARKPVVLLKSGVSERGRKAVSSHTGSLAGSDGAISAACRQTGVHRAGGMEEFLDLLRVLSASSPLLSRNVAVVTNAGGPGILATDAAEREGVSLTALAERTIKTLGEALPPAASSKNPVDVLGDAADDRYGAAMEACLDDPTVDGVVALLTPQVMTPCEEIARVIAAKRRKFPLFPIVASFMGGESVESAVAILEDGGVPCFPSPERAVRAIAALRECETHPIRQPVTDPARAATAEKILAGKTGQLDPETLAKLCDLYGVPLPRSAVATTADEAVDSAEAIGYPVIAKISAKEILHKTDVGGVRANLKTADEVRSAFDGILAAVKKNMPGAAVDGVLVQRFLPAGNEFIVGSVRDHAFGPLVLAGLGGIYTELFRDTALRIAPITEEDAYAMLHELKAWKLLMGMRGAAQSDVAALAGVIQAVAALVLECPRVVELDLNPVIVDANGIAVADAKVVLG